MLRKPSAASAAFFARAAAGENGRRAAVSFSVDLETRRRRCDRPLDATESGARAVVTGEPPSPAGDASSAAASSASARVAARSPAAENGDAREPLFDPDAPNLPRGVFENFSGVR